MISLRKKKIASGALSPVEIAIELTVSILSPVRTQNYIPAAFKIWMVPMQSFYNLSSTAVTPKNWIFFSISSITKSFLISLSTN